MSSDFDYLPAEQIYLDSACQTLRPQQVIDAVNDYYHNYNACGERVKYDWGRKVDEQVGSARELVLGLLGKSGKNYTCAFTQNTTYGINLLLNQLPRGMFEQVVTSDIEHNSVFLPAMVYANRQNIKRLILPRADNGALVYSPNQLQKSLVIINTTSNIHGLELVNAKHLVDDVHKQCGVAIFDAAQTMGHNPQLLKDIDFDAACFSGHKMYGPSLGIVVIRKDLVKKLEANFIGGGTVSDVSANGYQLINDELHTRLEPGLQNYSGIIGLAEAIRWRRDYKPGGTDGREYLTKLSRQLFDGLRQIKGLKLLNQQPAPIASFYSDKIDSHRLAIYLSTQNIMARSGYFCCHYYLDTLKNYPPLLRLSLGLNNTPQQIEKTLMLIDKLAGGK